MPSKDSQAPVSQEAVKETKIYIVRTASYYNGLYYDVGEIIRTDGKPTVYMEEVTEEQLKNRTAEKHVKYREDPFLELEKKRRAEEFEKQKRKMIF